MSGNRRQRSSIMANPVLVGAVTTLIVVVAVFLAYNANNGLPFVPTHEYKLRAPNGANVVPGNEVREGGYRVGVVRDMQPVRLANGKAGAELVVKLDEKVGKLPADTTYRIRQRSALGLKYVELHRGGAKDELPDGSVLSETRTEVPVELDDVLNTFDRPTREGSQKNLEGFGTALALRGSDLGRTIEEAPRLLSSLEPVMRNLASERTDIDGFFRGLGRTARAVAPVSETQARLFTTMADTFDAFSRDPQALKDTIAKQPETLRVGTESFRAQRPFLADTAAMSAELRGASVELRGALPTLNSALKVGTPVVERSSQLNDELEAAMAALERLAESPQTSLALQGLTETVGTMNPMVKFLGPYQTVCNYWNYFWTNVAEHLTENDPTGGSQRALLNTAGRQDNSVGSQGAVEPANGENVKDGTPQFFHGQAYTAAINNDGSADCEMGQRGYLKKLNTLADQKLKIVVDPHNPGSQGPTYKGRARVPAGQTFTREPETGPQLPAEVRP
jgi:virulence factor Mce-like protein